MDLFNGRNQVDNPINNGSSILYLFKHCILNFKIGFGNWVDNLAEPMVLFPLIILVKKQYFQTVFGKCSSELHTGLMG